MKIQYNGKIKVDSVAQFRAVESKIISMGLAGKARSEQSADAAGWIIWGENERSGKVDYNHKGLEESHPNHAYLPTHTLADFNLDENGNELGKALNMEDIEVGGKYAVRGVYQSPTYSLGDKVQVKGVYDSRTVAFVENEIVFVFDVSRDTPEKRKSGAMTYAYPLKKVTPWPEPIPFNITPNRPAIADHTGVTFDGITLTVEQLETALAKAKAAQINRS